MASYREIVTKAVIYKTDKKITKEYEILLENDAFKVIGAYILNHKVSGKISDNIVKIDGVFDTNMWYSLNNNTKTAVVSNRSSYEETVMLDLLSDNVYENSEVKINYITLPVCTKADIEKNKIIYEIQMHLSIQVIGEATIKISTFEDDASDNIENIEVNENYLTE